MRYLGGKERIAAFVSETVLSLAAGRRIVEPMCGGCSITARLVPAVAADINEALICLYQHLQRGWTPPDSLSEKEYAVLNATRDPSDPMTAFAGFGCSFAGKFFGGYARSGGRNYAANAKNSLLKKFKSLGNTQFLHVSFTNLHLLKGDLVYCDPPYAGTTGYSSRFDHELFYDWCRHAARHGVMVVVSEYAMPPDFRLLASKERPLEMDNNKLTRATRLEKIFVLP